MLDSEKIDFLADFLSGSGEIGKILLRQKGRFDYDASSVFPAGANNLDFRWGLPPDNDFGYAFADFEKAVKGILRKPKAFCLFRECDFKRHDPCMQDEVCNMVYAGEDIFYLLDGSSADELVVKTIKKASKFMLMCEFDGCVQRMRKGGDVSYGELEAMMDQLVSVAFGIFDDEGYCSVPLRRI